MGDKALQKGSRKTTPSVSESTDKGKKGDKSWKCDSCEHTFTEETDMLLTCEFCRHHRCIECLKITKSAYKSISGRADLPWFCQNCLKKSLESVMQTKTIEKKCEEIMSKFETKMNQRMEKHETEVKQRLTESESKNDLKLLKMKCEIDEEERQRKSGHEELKDKITKAESRIGEVEGKVGEIKANIAEEVEKTLKEKTKNEETTEGAEGVSVLEQTTKELQSRMDRKNNIVFYNVKEQEGNLKSEAVSHNINQIKDRANEIKINLSDEEITSVKGSEEKIKRLR